ncbi:HNH endonuclease signature motif containing protein [Gordonia shandongensis]|uniref:HNH endonuclease signature motif containing protein n=1 Tax=Gordonia shandongensis TaxID=376351 RepID=UPI0006863809|nr:HNH endonuclease signature motif containing protein [Gordonia shandongensis]
MTTIIAAPASPDLDALLPDDPVALAAVANAVAVKLAALPLAASTEGELLAAAESLEQARRRFDAADAAVLVEISDRGAYRTAGYLSLHAYLSGGLRVGDGAARRRRVAAAAIGRFTSMQGQTLEPRCPATAVAVADGAIGVDHVLEIDAVLTRIPAAVTTDVREGAEAQLAAVARTLTPAGVRTAGVRLLAHLDPDGQLTDDRDRRRLRGLALMPQDRQLMSRLRTRLTPGLRADLEVMLQSWAAPGMNNPDDPASPTGAVESADPAVVAAAAERDDRTPMQRNHDALHALLILARQQSPASGSLRSELVVTITDAELAAHAGIALTATGTRIPISELVRLAADATPHLAVFAHTTGEPLYLGRGRRLASRAQRLMLFARDRGCTAPGCAAPFARTEAHHFPDWQDGGPTDIDHLGAACGSHNRTVGTGPGQWETRIAATGPHTGRVHWRPVTPTTATPTTPPGTGSPHRWQINTIHHAELLPAPRPDPESGPPASSSDPPG